MVCLANTDPVTDVDPCPEKREFIIRGTLVIVPHPDLLADAHSPFEYDGPNFDPELGLEQAPFAALARLGGTIVLMSLQTGEIRDDCSCLCFWYTRGICPTMLSRRQMTGLKQTPSKT